jgi:hypothetical protein
MICFELPRLTRHRGYPYAKGREYRSPDVAQPDFGLPFVKGRLIANNGSIRLHLWLL